MDFDMIIHHGTCVTANGPEQVDVGIQDGKITALGKLDPRQAKEQIDATGLHVLPGVIDTQCHFREPGNEHKEDLATGTLSAVLGGVTTIFEMPNTNPPTTSVDAILDKCQRAQGRACCDFAFFAGGTGEDKDWETIENTDGCCGIKIFMGSSTGNLLVDDDPHIENILKNSKRRCSIHAEDQPRLLARKQIAIDGAHPRFHPIWRDEESAFLATKRIVRLAEKYQHPVHVLHITTAQEIEFLGQHKGLVSVEVTPQHLTLTDEDYDRIGSLAQMNPPIRSREHQAGLFAGITNGIVDVIGSDHAPHTLAEKEKPYPESPSGMPGVQTLVPLLLHHMSQGKLSLARFVDLTSSGPARIFNIKSKGRTAVGFDADFTIVDLNEKHTISHEEMASKCGWTPFAGMTLTGWPKYTLIRGHMVMANGKVLQRGLGKRVEFL